MRRLHIVLFSILPILLFIIAALLAWVAGKWEKDVGFRETQYASLTARAKSIDEAANLSPEAKNSASAFARIIITSDDVDRDVIQTFRGLAELLSSLASLQILLLAVLAYRSRSSNPALNTDAERSRRAG